jgi:hypothetical protein
MTWYLYNYIQDNISLGQVVLRILFKIFMHDPIRGIDILKFM